MSDRDDDWGRYRKRLLETKGELIKEMIAGGCDLPLYQNYCGKIAMIDEAIELAAAVRRGDDLRPPPARPPVPSPED